MHSLTHQEKTRKWGTIGAKPIGFISGQLNFDLDTNKFEAPLQNILNN